LRSSLTRIPPRRTQNTGGMGGVRRVEVRGGGGIDTGGGSWQELSSGWGATWELRWPLPPLPLSLRLTGDDGAVVLLPEVIRRTDELATDAQLRTAAQFPPLPPPPPFWSGDEAAAAAMAPFAPCPLGGDLVPASATARAAAAASAETATRTFLADMQALGLQPAEVPSDAASTASTEEEQQPLQTVVTKLRPLAPAAAAAAANFFRPTAQTANAAGAGAGGVPAAAGGTWGVGFTLGGSVVWGRQAGAATVATSSAAILCTGAAAASGPGCASPTATAAAAQAVHTGNAATPHCSSLHASSLLPPPSSLPGWCRLAATLPATMQPRACVQPPPPACP
jgi:hypothetical protein